MQADISQDQMQELGQKPLPDEEQQVQEHKTLNHHTLYYTFIQRYFHSFQNTTQSIHRHSNGLYVVRVQADQLPSRPLSIQDMLTVLEVRGKRKKGGLKVKQDTVIIEIRCEGGEIFRVYALVEGIILQKNQNLSVHNLDRPQGYVAVINPVKRYKPDPNIFEEILLPHQNK